MCLPELVQHSLGLMRFYLKEELPELVSVELDVKLDEQVVVTTDGCLVHLEKCMQEQVGNELSLFPLLS